MKTSHALAMAACILLILLVIAPSLAYAANESSSNTVQVPEPLTFSGSGGKSIGSIDVVEGTLTVHISTRTDCQVCYFGVSIYQDNNLDGVYASADAGDIYTSSVWSGGYDDIQRRDITVNHTVMGGQIKVAVDTSSSVKWELVIEQHPTPLHDIEGGVWDDETQSPIFDATITLVDEQGKKYSTGDNSLYGYHHYYFNRSFYGYQNYTLHVSAPGYNTKTLIITSEDFTSLRFPGWAVYKKAYLQPSGCSPANLPVKSTFESGDEDWEVLGDAQGGSSKPIWSSGFISAKDDAVGGVWYWNAPKKFLGDLRDAYNGILRFDLKQSATDSQFTDNDVILKTRKGSFIHKLEKSPGTDFTRFSVPIHETGWTEGSSGYSVSKSDFTAALGCVEAILIRGEYRDGADMGSIDNAMISKGGPEKEAESGVISCLVEDKEGKPLSGALVKAALESEPSKTLAQTLTDQNGLCKLEGLKEKTYILAANAMGYTAQNKSGTALSGRTILMVRFKLEPKGPPIDMAVTSVTPSNISMASSKAVTYNIYISNLGVNDVESIGRVTLTSADLDIARVIAITSSQGNCNIEDPSKIICDIGSVKQVEDLGYGDLNQIRLKVTLVPEKIGSFHQDIKVDSELYDDNPGNNKDSFHLQVVPYKIKGRVTVVNATNHALPLKNILLKVRTDKKDLEVYTNRNGRYTVEVDEPIKEFSLEALLKDKNGWITVGTESPGPYNRFYYSVVSLRTTLFNASGVESTVDVVFSPTYHYLESDTGTMTISGNGFKPPDPWLLRDAGLFYVNTYTAALYAVEKLKLDLDHDLPVDIILYKEGCFACYNKKDSHIQTNNKGSNSRYNSPNSPDNREYHEFGHHVHADSKMGGEDTYPSRGYGFFYIDKNHMGVKNSDSSDSVIEGFAEFYSLLVKGSPRYRWGGSVTNLERNLHLKQDKGDWVPDEEFNVASLLWDITDTNNEGGDNIAIGVDGLWRILQSEDITTVRSLYLKLEKMEVGGWDINKNGRSDLDDLFISHWFFYNADDDTSFDPDEGDLPGYGNFNPLKPTKTRYSRPRINGTALEFTLTDEKGSELKTSAFSVSVFFNESADDYSYKTWPDPDTGFLWVVLPHDAQKVEITPLLPGYLAEPFTQAPSDFWKAVEEAQMKNESVYGAHRFVVRENDIPLPDGFLGERINGTAVKLTWSSGGSFVLVRGIDHRPAYLGDGVTVFEGSGTEQVESGLLTGVKYYYTLFRVEDGELSKGVSVSFETEIVQPLLQTTPTPKPEKAPPVNESASPGRAAMSDDSEGSTGNSLYTVLILVIVASLIIWYWRNKSR